MAALTSIRSWGVFAVRPVSGRWLLIGVGAGLLAFILKGIVIMAFLALTGQDGNPQDVFATGASGGMFTILLATLFMGVLTPIGEEILFRGVVTNAPL